MKRFSRMILDSLKVTDDDDEFEDDEIELKERKQKQKEEKKSLAKKETPAMRRYESSRYDDDEEDDFEEEENSVAQKRAFRSQQYRERAQETPRREYREPVQPRTARQPQQPIRQPQAQPQPAQRTQQLRQAPPMRSQVTAADVCILRPKRFEECQEIIDVLKSGRVIFLTFDSTNPAIANRIMDFSFGAVYALDAQIIQLSGNNFVIAPEDAEISGEYINSLTASTLGSWNSSMDFNGQR